MPFPLKCGPVRNLRTAKITEEDPVKQSPTRTRSASLAQAFESWVGAEEDNMEFSSIPSRESLPSLEEIERQPSIEALEGLTSALKASSSSQCLTRLRQAPSVSKLHRMARFLHLKHSPPLKSQGRADPIEDEDCEDRFELAGSIPTRRALFHETELRPIEAVLQTRWNGLCERCSSGDILNRARELKAWKLALSIEACSSTTSETAGEPLTPACPAPLELPLPVEKPAAE